MNENLQSIAQEITSKKVLIVGFGVEGQSTYRFIRHFSDNTIIGICDANEDNVNSFLDKTDDRNIVPHLGESYLDGDFSEYTLVIKTPGIPSEKLKNFPNQDIITSQIDIFLKHYGKQVIGITGTKGKSTTASLLHKILLDQGQKCALVGNIGIPAFDIMIDNNEYDYYVCELSSHQLEKVRYSPHIAIILNIYQDHLDYYGTYEKYIDAKMNIFANQDDKDYLLIGENVDLTNREVNSDKKTVAIKEDAEFITYQNSVGSIDIALSDMMLKGHHNLLNLQFCLSVCEILENENAVEKKVINDLDQLKTSVAEFEGLAHRMEYVGDYDGIHFYNDSICTIPEAAISAMKAFDNANTIILGGYDRQIDYTELCEYLSQKPVENVILMPDSGYRIYDQLQDYEIEGLNIFKVYDLDEAVMIALRYTEKGTTCLFSPAAASYTFFKNFIDRGNKFKECVAMYASHA